MLRALPLALSLLAAEAYSPACSSRLGASRVASLSRTPLCMCDAADAPAPAGAVDESPAVEEQSSTPRRQRPAKTALADLEVGSEVEGKIRSVMTYGAFVDIGAFERTC